MQQQAAAPSRIDVPGGPSRARHLAVYVVLVAAVVALYGRTARFGSLNFDDPPYVFDNAQVRAGLTWPGVVWAFTRTSGIIQVGSPALADRFTACPRRTTASGCRRGRHDRAQVVSRADPARG